MSFFRPEAIDWLHRNIISALPFAFSVFMVVIYIPGVFRFDWVAIIMVLFFSAGAYATIPNWLLKRKRRHRSNLPLKVQVNEGSIDLYDPTGVLKIEIAALTKVEIRTTADGPFEEDVFWRLSAADQMVVIVPNGIEGADKLMDALGILPGFSHMQVVMAMGSTAEQVFTIWSKDD